MDALLKLKKLQADANSIQNTDKKPRHYADEICKMTSREERAKALEAVPECFRNLVRLHVQNYFMLRTAKKKETQCMPQP